MVTTLVAGAKVSVRNFLRTAAPGVLCARVQTKWDREPEISLLPALCDPKKISVDVGANWGQYVGRLRELSSSVIACEPVPQLAKFLRRAWPDGIQVEQAALSNVNGSAEFFVDSDWSRSSIHGTGGTKKQRRVPVNLRTMDSIVKGPVGFIKIDVEGHEEEVIEGARRVISENHPVVLAEIEERHRPGAIERVPARLSAWGYTGWFLEGRRMRPISEFRAEEHQNPEKYPDTGDANHQAYINNFVFIHQSCLAEKTKRLADIGYAAA